MRILIGYNATEFAKAAIDDLGQAGMPDRADVLILTVAELCFPTVPPQAAGAIAAEGAALVKERFPEWSVSARTTSGAPVREILFAARTFHPDIIVLGEPSRADGKAGRFLGPVSQGVLTDGDCGLRIARGSASREERPTRLLVGFDGSDGAELAVSIIANRSWSEGTSVRLLSIDGTGVLGSIGLLNPQMRAVAVGAGFSSKWAETIASNALAELSEAGLDAAIEVRSGHPDQALIDAAEEWDADCIFVAPHSSGNSFDRFLVGSVSASVAAHANCTVEVVRGK